MRFVYDKGCKGQHFQRRKTFSRSHGRSSRAWRFQRAEYEKLLSGHGWGEGKGHGRFRPCVLRDAKSLAPYDVQNISEFMRRVNTTYAKFFNRINGRSGYVFNGRYESDALKTPDEILAAIYFVHNNPVKARVAVNSGEYLYSSAKDYLNQLSFIDYKELKRLFKKVPELSSYGGSTDEYKFKEAKPYENCDDVLMDLIRRFNITDKAALQDPELLITIIYELQTRSGVSLRDVAVLVGLDREKIRRTAKKINYNV